MGKLGERALNWDCCGCPRVLAGNLKMGIRNRERDLQGLIGRRIHTCLGDYYNVNRLVSLGSVGSFGPLDIIPARCGCVLDWDSDSTTEESTVFSFVSFLLFGSRCHVLQLAALGATDCGWEMSNGFE